MKFIAGCFGLLFVVFLAISCNTDFPSEKRIEIPTHGNIVMVGNAFAERLQYYNYFETLLYKSFPEENFKFRNLGWSGDEIDIHSRPLNFPSQDSLLCEHKADIILVCYGMNESYRGVDSLASFGIKLKKYLEDLKSKKYNKQSSPQIVLISPIAFEEKENVEIDAKSRNKLLSLYVQEMDKIAKEIDVFFVDLFDVSRKLYGGNKEFTINGIHLNDSGYQIISEVMAKSLGLSTNRWETTEEFLNLKKVIDYKNEQYFYLYRAVNWEYIEGRRKEPWIQPPGGPISFPSELDKLNRMVSELDQIIWKQNHESNIANIETAERVLNDPALLEETKKTSFAIPSSDQFVLPEGFEINLFASEMDFSLHNPVKMNFDPDGRLWVSTLPSYPHYLPGKQPDDKIIILEDTDRDGIADQEIIFAENLYMPLSFELGKGGVYVSQPPNMWFMKDTNGDFMADEKEIILQGFGTEDVHHTLSTYTWGPDGALYWHSGTFLHSQVESPYGVQRCDYGATWRYDPNTLKVEPYISYPYANPWGHVFTREGMEMIADVSTGMNYFAPPLTVNTSYPKKLSPMNDFLTSDNKPKTCGTEIISSSHFPKEMQGDILFNIFVKNTGIHQHRIFEKGSGIIAEEIEPILKSKDPYFRPVDLQFGPDGALYVLDWYNPIINHGERALRDPMRDHSHGRVWRITYKNNNLLEPMKFSHFSIYELLENLKKYEDRLRYRVRTQLRQFDAKEVVPILDKWLSDLDIEDPLYDQHRLEALWVFQQFNSPRESLLDELLGSESDEIRTAATRVLFYWKDKIEEGEKKLIELASDESMKVRLQALVSLTHINSEISLDIFLEALDLPRDYYIEYVLKENFRRLKPIWWKNFVTDPNFLINDIEKAHYLFRTLTDEEEFEMPGFLHGDPDWKKYTWNLLTTDDFTEVKNKELVEGFLQMTEDGTALSLSRVELGEKLIAKSDCASCHKVSGESIGPSYKEIATRYEDKDEEISVLSDKIIKGGSGVWGEAVMTPHPELTSENAHAIVEYILSIQ